MGGQFRFGCRLEDLDLAQGAVRGLHTSSGYLKAAVVVLAIGHSARDTYEMLYRQGVPLVAKPFQIGVRIEQSQEQVNRVQYGAARLEEKFGAADYTLVARGPTPLFTFCMCAGGYVMPSVSEPGYFCTNGMSLSKRDSQYANSGLMITLEPEHFGSAHPLAGMMLQRSHERQAFEAGRGEYACPIQRAEDFLGRRRSTGRIESSYPRQVVSADLATLVPRQVVAALHAGLPLLDRRWRGEFLRGATLVGPEARVRSGAAAARRQHAGMPERARAIAGGRGGRLCRRNRERGAGWAAGREGDYPAVRAAGTSVAQDMGSTTSTRLTTSSTPAIRLTIASANFRSWGLGTWPCTVSTPSR